MHAHMIRVLTHAHTCMSFTAQCVMTTLSTLTKGYLFTKWRREKIASRNLSWWLSYLGMYNTEQKLIFVSLICDMP